MKEFIIRGGNNLRGISKVCSSKNAILPLLAASILSSGQVILKDIPNFSDIHTMVALLKSIGAEVQFENRTITINPLTINSTSVPEYLAVAMRASFFCLGPLLGKFGTAQISYPGGCKIGSRPIDLHLLGLNKLGATIVEDNGRFICDTKSLIGSEIVFSFPSVGATENVMMAAVLAKGTTVIINPAREPEIVDLANFLKKMGAKIKGAGTKRIEIVGVDALQGVEYTPIPDRIVAGTLAIAVATVGGKVELNNVRPSHITSLLNKLKKYSCQIKQKNDTLVIESISKKSIPLIQTKPFPGFPTDLQSQILVLESVSEGKSTIVENLFETRFHTVEELKKMGAQIVMEKNKAHITGVKELFGANVRAHDLRAGAALVIAGMKAKGITTVTDIENIDRGYEAFEVQLNDLGADIKRY